MVNMLFERASRLEHGRRPGVYLSLHPGCSRNVGVLLIVFATTAAALSTAARAAARPDGPDNPCAAVNPMVGTVPEGHTFPGATVPFGMVQVSPDTRTSGWEACSGYDYQDSTILGFSHTHLIGTGCGDLGDILLMPTVGAVDFTAYQSRFSHDQERAEPGYYKVFLQDPKVQVELTATPRVGIQRYTFPATSRAHVIIDLVHGISNRPLESSLQRESNTVISGHRKTHGWAADRDVWFVIEFSRPFKSLNLQCDGQLPGPGTTQVSGALVRGDVDFDAQAGQPLIVKVALSPTSLEEAHKNMAAEAPGWDFDGIRSVAAKAWKKALSVITVETPDPALRQTFYTNLYQSLQAPVLFSDADGTYRGQDHRNHEYAGFQKYTEFSLWDIYRAEAPLLTIIQPRRVPDMAASMLADYRELGAHSLPKWPLWGNETWCMIGYHAVPILVDAYFKGLIRRADVAPIYDAIRDTAMQDRDGLGEYKELGYIPMGHGNQSVSSTLEYAMDDGCIAKMAAALGHTEDAALFEKRSNNFRNVYDASTHFMRAKSADGQWRTPFNPLLCTFDDYTEADAWQYAFAVQQDVPALVQLMGGDKAFIRQMDQLFATNAPILHAVGDISGLIGQYSQGDEQCHHVAYLYNYAGAPWKTQEHVREIIRTMYTNRPDGQCGNVDCGEMNAWYVLSAMGFFPVNPVTGVYVIGSPAVNRAILHLDQDIYHGKTFTVAAKNNSPENIYIQSARLNGAPLNRSWITHSEITAGGELDLVMGPQPNKDWASSPSARPPAGFPPGEGKAFSQMVSAQYTAHRAPIAPE
ncbi:MAG: GH92 family glycosyl hydrolase [Chthoniobacteraceae bacterium]|jgi:predicted alpha-1,2-mannosidase